MNKQQIFQNYIDSISRKFQHEETSEMGYRTDFEILLKEIFDEKILELIMMLGRIKVINLILLL